jgi:hypothetical protein
MISIDLFCNLLVPKIIKTHNEFKMDFKETLGDGAL